MKYIKFLIILIACLSAGFQLTAQEKFSFAFLTDMHVNGNPKSRSLEGLKQAIRSAEASGAEFIISGGDNVDVDGMKAERRTDAIKLYKDYKSTLDASSLKWYLTIGNHDRFWYEGKPSTNYGTGLFSSYFGETYYSFQHKGWLFIVLNSVQVCDGKYCIDEKQKQWLAGLLANTAADQPIVISTHVPFLSLYYPVLEGRYTDADTFSNQKEIFDMFSKHNLKLVLQGHQHLYEEIKVKGVQFITAGAVSANWWGGEFHGTQEGYLKVDIDGEDFKWTYKDYGWEVKK
ncbi:3',5'-cyclic adenosine monophosphate phosphodiesterase CpdA [compost metagenome]